MSWHRLNFEDFIRLQRGFDLPKARMQHGEVPVLGSNCIVGYHNEPKVEPPGVDPAPALHWVQLRTLVVAAFSAVGSNAQE